MADPTTPDAARARATATDEGTPPDRLAIPGLPTGVPGLDVVLGGGLPEYSLNLVTGAPGTGKTTLALQLVFANATPERPALVFSMVGEPTLKLLRYQQQFTFFRPEALGTAVHIRNLSTEMLEGDFDVVLSRIADEVDRNEPGIVVVDSFRWTEGGARGAVDAAGRSMGVEEFVQRLAVQLTAWEVTSLMLGEFAEADQRQQVFTVADGIIALSQARDRNSVVRKLQITKARGRAHMPGLHTFRMSNAGIQVFPRIPEQQGDRRPGRPRDGERLATGVPGLDVLMGGGIPTGDAVMIVGPTGSGKTTVGMQFVAEGLRAGEACVVAVFEEYPEAYLARLASLGVDVDAVGGAGRLAVTYLRPLDLSVDETLAEILLAVRRHGATRVVIDSLSGFEVALAPTFREDFRESLYRLVGALTATGVTVLMTLEAVVAAPDGGFTGERVSFITDDIIIQRYVEIGGALQKVLAVVKMRRSRHSAEFRSYTITPGGAVVGEPLTGYQGIRTGSPEHGLSMRGSHPAGLTAGEAGVLGVLVRLGGSTVPTLAAQLLLPDDEVGRALARLAALGYVEPLTPPDAAGVTAYRAVARLAPP